MTQPIGGTRLRLIEMSIYSEINRCLTGLGYFGGSWPGLSPVHLNDVAYDNDQEIKPNQIFVSPEPITALDAEMGSTLEENTQTFYVDVFAESAAVGTLIAGDVRDIVRGKMASLGRTVAGFTVLDYRLATPTPLFNVEVRNCDYSPAATYSNQVKRFYYVVGFEIIDWYDNAGDGGASPDDIDGGFPGDIGDDLDGGGP